MASPLSPFRSLPSDFRAILHAFTQSSSTFRIVRTVRSDSTSPSPAPSTARAGSPSTSPPETLYVLDSSFNPPTLGHLDIALSALKDDPAPHTPKHVLLLLATQNADKAPKPAAFEQRLTMMSIMAENLLSSFRDSYNLSSPIPSSSSSSSSSSDKPSLTVSVGVTKYPYFLDKSFSIAGKDSETPFPFPPTHQVHLTGFDTFIRLLDAKYYNDTLTPLEPFFTNHSVRVTYRTGDKFGSRDSQEQYRRDFADGKREFEGGQRAWAEKVKMVEGRNGETSISSTKAREGVRDGDDGIIEKMCGKLVAQWVVSEGLYKDE